VRFAEHVPARIGERAPLDKSPFDPHPNPLPAREREQKGWGIAAALVTAAAGLAACVVAASMLLHGPNPSVATTRPTVEEPQQLTAGSRPQETRSCDILPPLLPPL
jgi:hypothetical protein